MAKDKIILVRRDIDRIFLGEIVTKLLIALTALSFKLIPILGGIKWIMTAQKIIMNDNVDNDADADDGDDNDNDDDDNDDDEDD